MQQILCIDFIFHTQCGSIFPSESQLPSDGVESTTENFDELDRI